MLPSDFTTKDIERFWSRVHKDNNHPKGCWEWDAPTRTGYGQFGITVRKSVVKMLSAHRASWILTYGNIPKGLHVLHHCDNPKCVNPNHLFLGTNLDNILDKVRKNRQTKGEQNGRAKLTWEQVREIRKRYRRNSRKSGTVALAREYGVTNALIGKIIRNELWPED